MNAVVVTSCVCSSTEGGPADHAGRVKPPNPVRFGLSSSDRAFVTIPSELTSAVADRYVIEREIGRGGMATVYLARDLRHRRAVALRARFKTLGEN